ncbi:D-galactarate dehydratase [Synergistales bacterium]|nr:D-galactarate dehydratase [Synergistales bacterium]
MKINGIYSKPGDTVVTVTDQTHAGDVVSYTSEGQQVTFVAVNDVPKFHKMAIEPKKKGETVKKYGERIGVALKDFAPGEHVHTHNLGSREED